MARFLLPRVAPLTAVRIAFAAWALSWLSMDAAAQTVLGGLNRPARVEESTADWLDRAHPQPLVGETAPDHLPPEKQEPPSPERSGDPFVSQLAGEAQQMAAGGLGNSTAQTALFLGALSLAPAILLMTTCYVRIIVVLGLLKQAIGIQQLPPAQVTAALAIFLTMLVMGPVWHEVKTTAIDPYRASGSEMPWEEAVQRGVAPVKRFMLRQIEITRNTDSLRVFYRYAAPSATSMLPSDLEQIPVNVVLPAFLLSELKVAFLLGFQIFLPFLVLDLVVSTVTVSMGMVMLPPAMVSLPLKLILFVMVDGWNLVVGMLLQSFGPLGLPL